MVNNDGKNEIGLIQIYTPESKQNLIDFDKYIYEDEKNIYKDMILIADCGSTKIDWCVIENGKVVKQIFTCGMNAIMLTEEEMAERIKNELRSEVEGYQIDEVYFYGAGCISDEVCGNVRRACAAADVSKD